MFRLKKFLLICIIQVTISGANNEFCEIWTCSNPNRHVYCKYKSDDYGTACGSSDTNTKVFSIFDPNEHINKTLAAHNKYRQQARCEKAIHVSELKWDSELAKMAEKLSKQCLGTQNDGCRNLNKYGSVVYQNVHAIYKNYVEGSDHRFEDADIEATVKHWSEQPDNPVWPSVEFHHNLNLVGCGVTRITTDVSPVIHFTRHYNVQYHIVCNYAKSK